VSEQRQRAIIAELLAHAPLWRTADERARRLARGVTDDADDATRMADEYRLLAHDLARARKLVPATRSREFLELAYARAHATLYHGAWHLGAALATLLRDELPCVVRWLAPYILAATAIFLLAVSAGYTLVHRYPELIALFASPDLIATVERGQLWTEGLLNIVPSSLLSVQLLANNIAVSLLAYCAGFLFGLGTLYILGLNGLMLGAVFAFVSQHGLRNQLLTFIVAHGCVELSVMCLSGAAGMAVGAALMRPGPGGRIEAFRHAALRSGALLLACAILLLGSGILEGFVSPDPRISLAPRVLIGVGYWLLMVAWLSGVLFGWRGPGGYTRRARRNSA
jgi:uncharacterized membrane protein SpoIIM required for sporulation